MTDVDTSTAVYVYAVTRGLETTDVGGLVGIHGRPARLVEHAGLCAVVSDVELDEFGDDGLRKNLEDLAWVEDVARTHDRVVAESSRLAPTAPFRLATICFGDDSVRERIATWYDSLTDALDRVEGRDEWGVKVYARSTPAPVPAGGPANESGTAYLTRLRAEHDSRASEAETAAILADRIHETVAARVVASRRMPSQDPRLAGHSDAMTLNGTYLVDRGREDDVRELVAGLVAEHPEARIELTGPWPPYTFAALEAP